jgi:hypothetical protein
LEGVPGCLRIVVILLGLRGEWRARL